MEGEVSNTHQQNQLITTPYTTVPDLESLLRLSSHQGIPLSGNILQEDFQKLLSKMELHHSRAVSHSLVEDTFPDSCVPFNLDKLLNTDIAKFVVEDNK